MRSDVRVRNSKAGFRSVMHSQGVRSQLASLASQACARAESQSGLHFGCGVDENAVSCRAWVGARSVDSRTGRFNPGLYAKQADALSKALYGSPNT